jgi:hypothetical protein
MAAAAAELGKDETELDLEREDGSGEGDGGGDRGGSPAGPTYRRGNGGSQRRYFPRRPIFAGICVRAGARGRLRTLRWLPPCSSIAPARPVPREVTSMAPAVSSCMFPGGVDVLC